MLVAIESEIVVLLDQSKQRPLPRRTTRWQGEDQTDVFTSMVSGHATVGFAVAVATGIVATLRRRPSAPWLWLTGLTIATLSGYMRIAADRHYVTDVIAGAALGSAVGVLVPLLLQGRERPAVLVVPEVSTTSGVLSVQGTF